MKILAIYTDWKERETYGGCGYYRCIAPMRHLGIKTHGKLMGEGCMYPEKMDAVKLWTDIWMKYDVIYTMKVDGKEALAQMYASRTHFKKKIILDVDDDYFNIDPKSSAKKHITPDKYYIIEAMLRNADMITVSTEYLKKQYEKYNGKITVIPNYIDMDDWAYENRIGKDGRIKIGWQGSSTHETDLKMIIPVLKKIMNKFDNVDFVHVGYDSKIFKELPRRKFVPGTNEFPEAPKLIADQGFDIGIAPLADIKFNYSKSAIKYYEYSALKIPTVCTGNKWSPYHGKFHDGKTGMYANNEKEWYDKLTKLIKDKQLRKQMGLNAYSHVKQTYHIKDHTDEWRNVFERANNIKYKEKPQRSKIWTPPLLLTKLRGLLVKPTQVMKPQSSVI